MVFIIFATTAKKPKMPARPCHAMQEACIEFALANDDLRDAILDTGNAYVRTLTFHASTGQPERSCCCKSAAPDWA